MCDHNNLFLNLRSKFEQFFVTLFNFLVEGLILNLELFKIDKMETISKLLLFLKNFLFCSQSITQSDILKPILIDFLIMDSLRVLPLIQNFFVDLLTSTREQSILSYRTFKFFELLFDFVTLGLLLIEFGL